MSEENKTTSLSIDFGSPEATIKNIVQVSEELIALLWQETVAQGLAKIALEKAGKEGF